jgi:hypothetical protein
LEKKKMARLSFRFRPGDAACGAVVREREHVDEPFEEFAARMLMERYRQEFATHPEIVEISVEIDALVTVQVKEDESGGFYDPFDTETFDA